MEEEREFPIMFGTGVGYHEKPLATIPWKILEPHEDQAYKNHCQSLHRLAERGGLSPCEAIAVIEDRSWRPVKNAWVNLAYYVLKYRHEQKKKEQI